MKESLMVFEQICNSKWFSQTSMILFLNKIDLFQAKLRYSSLTSYFPDFKGTFLMKDYF
jgi:G-protein alpha subunit